MDVGWKGRDGGHGSVIKRRKKPAETGDSSGIWKRFGVARVCDEWWGSGRA